MPDDARGAPLPWIVQWAELIGPDVTILDLAAGRGRHALFFAERGNKVLAVDRDTSRLPTHANIESMTADLEDGSPWPLAGRQFGAAIVTNYLYRPLMPALLDALLPGACCSTRLSWKATSGSGSQAGPSTCSKTASCSTLCVAASR